MSTKQSAISNNGGGRPMEMAAESGGSGGWGGWGKNSTATSIRQSFGRLLGSHDSMYSVASDYDYDSGNDLNMWQGAALLTADCLGTGILALPQDIRVLGLWCGVGFLILNLPINFYAGSILSHAASHVERQQVSENKRLQSGEEEEDGMSDESPLQDGKNQGGVNYNAIANEDVSDEDYNESKTNDRKHPSSLHHDTATFDFIGMTSALFHKAQATRWAMILFYTNIFLVLGDYILVMSHAVAALLGEDWVCIPVAGVVASTLMFAVCQLRTMSNLGRSASIISLSALFIVVMQCLYYANTVEQIPDDDEGTDDGPSGHTILRKLSAMGSIGFAVGSQKLFLNIRHELADRASAPKSLAISLTAFGTFYVAIVLCAGSNPPGFLFDAIPPGINRRIAGFFLWVHVVVSYAINSQAICASMDRIFFYRWGPVKNLQDHHRWMILTGFMALSAFFVANAIPFFKDLVALIGALTSVPLTLLLPALFHRKVLAVPIWCPTKESLVSYALVLFSLLFITAALIGSVNSIVSDWENHQGGFFACN